MERGGFDGQGIGDAVPRLEDDRLLRGRGEFVADIHLPGMRELAFPRSPVPHARIRGGRKPAGAEANVFVAAGLAETVARNLEQRLAGEMTGVVPARLSATGLLLRLVWQGLRRWLRRP